MSFWSGQQLRRTSSGRSKTAQQQQQQATPSSPQRKNPHFSDINTNNFMTSVQETINLVDRENKEINTIEMMEESRIRTNGSGEEPRRYVAIFSQYSDYDCRPCK